MISRLPSTYPAIQSNQPEPAPRRLAMVARSSLEPQAGRVKRAVELVAVIAVEVCLLLGFTLLSLGIGAETHAGTGPDRPLQPVPAAPAGPPELALRWP